MTLYHVLLWLSISFIPFSHKLASETLMHESLETKHTTEYGNSQNVDFTHCRCVQHCGGH